jgi:hypothetical protein
MEEKYKSDCKSHFDCDELKLFFIPQSAFKNIPH